ncbi:hypothetical protein ACOSP7_003109 [Xanthoceras sorbifolium]
MNLSKKGSYDTGIFLGTPSRSNSNTFLAFCTSKLYFFDAAAREREVLQEQVAAFEVEKVTALKAEKVALEVKKDEAIASLNRLLEDAVAARKSRKIWRAPYQKKRLPILDMHMEIPSKEGDPKIYAIDKAGSHFLGGPVDKGPDLDYDYSHLFSKDEEDLVLSEKEESEDESDDDQAPFSKFMKGDISSNGVDVGESSNKVDSSQNRNPLVP